MSFSRLRISNWRQFRELDISFHDRLTILTGANGAGKTSILNILSSHFGWNAVFVSTPRRMGTEVSFFADSWTDEYLDSYANWLAAFDNATPAPVPATPPGHEQNIGELTYADGSTTALRVPSSSVGSSFQISMPAQKPQMGIHIPSHRATFSHQPVENIPTSPRRWNHAFSTYSELTKNRYYGMAQRAPNVYLKETLIGLAAFGYGNEAIARDEANVATFEGFQRVLGTVLPPSLGFIRLAVRLPEVVLITRSGDFSLDAVSGGVASLIDLSWQIFLLSRSDMPFVVTIDEPENHLHPELQRTVLATFLTAFPKVQFICATHNPFIVTSVPDSNTYALTYGNDSKVRSLPLTDIDRSGTSNEVLRDVLGLPSASPTWVENRLAEITKILSDREITADLVDEIQSRLREWGLERFLPISLAALAKEKLRND
jgi:predicted ATPase